MSGPLYPNQPLVEVAAEVRFEGELSVEQLRAKFQEKIRGKYPDLRVPNAKEGVSPTLQPYRFESKDGDSGVQVAINSISYFSKNYPGHVDFLNELGSLIEKFLGLVGDLRVTRIGWRYINAIPYAREKGFLPLRRYFRDSEYFGNMLGQDLSNVILRISKDGESMGHLIKLESGKISGRPGEEHLLLDIDAFETAASSEKVSAREILSKLSDVHDKAFSVFDSIISDNYRTFLKGDTQDG